MYIPGGGWTPVDALYHERLNQNNLLQPGAADEGLSILLGFSEEFIRSISSYPNLFSAPTVTRLCKSVDRRFPIREYHPKSATLEQRTHSIELVVQLFQILSGNNSGELSGANDRQLLYNQSTGLVEMLRISHDLKNIIAKIDHWTEVLGAERHVSKEFVTKTLNTRSICG
jgi:hypothetical protein